MHSYGYVKHTGTTTGAGHIVELGGKSKVNIFNIDNGNSSGESRGWSERDFQRRYGIVNSG